MKTFKFLISNIERYRILYIDIMKMFGFKFVVVFVALSSAYLFEFSQSRPFFLRGGYGIHPAFASILYPHDNTVQGQWSHYKMIRDVIRDKFYLNVGAVAGLLDSMGTFS